MEGKRKRHVIKSPGLPKAIVSHSSCARMHDTTITAHGPPHVMYFKWANEAWCIVGPLIVLGLALIARGSSCTACALRGHCVHAAHTEAGMLTQVIRLVVAVLFPRNPFQKNEQSKNI